jgi:hypothetical protein
MVELGASMDDDGNDHEDEGLGLDPASIAGAAKAAGAVGKAANTLTKNSVFSALFLPMAKAQGDHWGRETRERLAAAAEAKKRRNLQAHLEAVRGKVTGDFDPDLTQRWVDGSEHIDPVDRELSEAWHAVLLGIATGDPLRRRLLDAVRSMSADEAEAFMLFAHNRAAISLSPDHRRRLASLGLLEHPVDFLMGYRAYPIYALVGLGIMGLLVSDALGEIIGLYARVTPIMFAMIVFVGVMALSLPVLRPRLTNLGTALLRLTRKVESIEKPATADEAPTAPTPEGSSPTSSRRSATASRSRKSKSAQPKQDNDGQSDS